MQVRTPNCTHCGKHSIVEVPDTKYELWQNGMLIQEVMPELSAEERELLITGTHPECWDAIMGEIDDWEKEGFV